MNRFENLSKDKKFGEFGTNENTTKFDKNPENFNPEDFFSREAYIKPNIKKTNFKEDIKATELINNKIPKKDSRRNSKNEDNVNFLKTVSDEEIIQKYKEIKEKNKTEKFDLNKFKAGEDKNSQKLINNYIKKNSNNKEITNENPDDEDLDIELVGKSEHITNFENSIDNFKDLNKKSSLSVISETNEYKKELNHGCKSMLNLHDRDLKISAVDLKNENFINAKHYQDEINSLKNELEEFHDKFDKRTKEYLDYKNKFESLEKDVEYFQSKINEQKNLLTKYQHEISEKDGVINNIKLEVKKKDENLAELNQQIMQSKTQAENIKNEYNLSRTDLSKKSEKVSELQQKIFQLEKEMEVNKIIILGI
jgi:hypothetical protein